MHLSRDAQTLEIRAIEITDNAIGDAPMLPELLSQIPADEQLHSMSSTVPTGIDPQQVHQSGNA